MKRSLFASLFLVAMCAIASGSHTTRSVTATGAGVTAPQFGACRWFCDSPTAFKTEAACEATCSHECEAVC